MIIKSFQVEKMTLEYNFLLFYGENQGYKNQIIEEKFKTKYKENTYYYEESDILNNKENFFSNILTRSFCDNEKLIIINRVTDKIKDLIEEIVEKKIQDLIIILNANALEKKSKIRSFFFFNKETACVAFYEDNVQSLSSIINVFFRKNKISISQQAINIIVGRCRGDRQNLYNELEKIKNFTRNKNKIEIHDLLKLTNLAENYNVSELIDCCLSKNKKRTINILNENNYSVEDCMIIIRTLLTKTKRLVKLCKELLMTNDIDLVVAGCKPAIFWKDKEVVKQQVRSWSFKRAEYLSYEINEIELLIKKNPSNSINILSNFIIEKVTSISN